MASHGTRAKVFNDWLRDAFTSMDEYTSTGRRRSHARKSKNTVKAKRSVAEQIKDATRQEKHNHKRKVYQARAETNHTQPLPHAYDACTNMREGSSSIDDEN